MAEIRFSDEDDPQQTGMVGTLTVLVPLQKEDEAFLKAVFEIFVKIVMLWMRMDRTRAALLAGLQDLFSAVKQEVEHSCTYSFRGWWHREAVCSACGRVTRCSQKDLPKRCPGCGARVVAVG